MKEHKLEGLVDCVMEGVEALSKQMAATGAELNTTFAEELGKIALTYGEMEMFNA